MHQIVELILITLAPFLELRASIPYGILIGMDVWLVFFVCVITNIILGLVVYYLLDKFIHLVVKIKWIGKIYDKIVVKVQHRLKKYVEKYGEWGVALFIGIPLPGSGVYSGALGSYLIGLKYKKFIIAEIIGVIIAGAIITLIVVSGSSLFIK
ncbi:MAG: small multi-drug export protein [Nanoarchaeota archaeon]|nr:small multi-drug export protein [Nanoarchaeota archaeon]